VVGWPPPRDSAAFDWLAELEVDSPVLAAALLSSFKHLTHHRGCVMRHAGILFPRFTGFLDPVRLFP